MRKRGVSKIFILISSLFIILLLLFIGVTQPVMRSLKNCLNTVNEQHRAELDKFYRNEITKNQAKIDYVKFRQDTENCRDIVASETNRPKIVVDFVIWTVK